MAQYSPNNSDRTRFYPTSDEHKMNTSSSLSFIPAANIFSFPMSDEQKNNETCSSLNTPSNNNPSLSINSGTASARRWWSGLVLVIFALCLAIVGCKDDHECDCDTNHPPSNNPLLGEWYRVDQYEFITDQYWHDKVIFSDTLINSFTNEFKYTNLVGLTDTTNWFQNWSDAYINLKYDVINDDSLIIYLVHPGLTVYDYKSRFEFLEDTLFIHRFGQWGLVFQYPYNNVSIKLHRRPPND